MEINILLQAPHYSVPCKLGGMSSVEILVAGTAWIHRAQEACG